MGSVEGRVAIQYINAQAPKDNFTFKCQRVNCANNSYQEIYAVSIQRNLSYYGNMTNGRKSLYSLLSALIYSFSLRSMILRFILCTILWRLVEVMEPTTFGIKIHAPN